MRFSVVLCTLLSFLPYTHIIPHLFSLLCSVLLPRVPRTPCFTILASSSPQIFETKDFNSSVLASIRRNHQYIRAMSVATKLHSPVCEPRAILGPGGNRVRVPEDPKRKGEALKKPQQRRRKPTAVVSEVPQSVVRSNGSVDSSCSSDSSSSGSLAKPVSSKKTTPAPVRRKGLKPVKVVPDGVEVVAPTTRISGPPKRCDWITPNSGKLVKPS